MSNMSNIVYDPIDINNVLTTDEFDIMHKYYKDISNISPSLSCEFTLKLHENLEVVLFNNVVYLLIRSDKNIELFNALEKSIHSLHNKSLDLNSEESLDLYSPIFDIKCSVSDDRNNQVLVSTGVETPPKWVNIYSQAECPRLQVNPKNIKIILLYSIIYNKHNIKFSVWIFKNTFYNIMFIVNYTI